MRMPPLAIVAATLLLGACGSVEYKDTNADVDKRPECEQGSQQPGAPVAPWCQRSQSATWSTDSKSQPIDFGKKN